MPDNDPTKRYYRFKQSITLNAIADGLRTQNEADWLEQKNIEFERPRRRELRNLMNRRDELKTTGPAVEAALRGDLIVRASGYCP